MIELRHVGKKYGERVALRDVSLRFPEGMTTVIVGPSGSGKSTLLRLVNRMIEPDSGRIFLRGEDVASLDPIALRRGMGYAIQGVGLFPHMTVAHNIAVVPRLLKWDQTAIDARVAELLDLVRLPADFASRFPRELSGGEAQRVGVARALAADPPVLLMDEPFGALDVMTRELLQEEFARIRQRLGKTVVFVTHDPAEALRLAHRIVVVREGKIVREGSPAELIARPEDSFVADFLGSVMRLERLIHDLESAAPEVEHESG